MPIRRPKCLKYYLPVSNSSKEWEKTRETQDEIVLGRKVFRRHILTNEEAKCSIYWLSPETSPKRPEWEKADLENSTSSTSALSKILETNQEEKNHQDSGWFSSSLPNPPAPHTLDTNNQAQEALKISTSLSTMVDEPMKPRPRGSKQTRARIIHMKTLPKTRSHHFLDRYKTKTQMSNKWDLDETLHLPDDPYFLDQEEREKIIHDKMLSHHLASETSFVDSYSPEDSSNLTCQVSDDTSIHMVNPLIPLSIWRHRLRYNQPISFHTTSWHLPYKRIKSFRHVYPSKIQSDAKQTSYTTASSRREKTHRSISPQCRTGEQAGEQNARDSSRNSS